MTTLGSGASLAAPLRLALIVFGLVVAAALVSSALASRLLNGAAKLAGVQTARAAPARGAAPPAVPVTAATVARADVPIRLSALGSVTAFNTVTVRPRVDGQLVSVSFREGQFVKQGDQLAQIDPRPFQVQLEQAEGQLSRDQAQLANARVDLTRYQTLWSEDSIAQQNVTAQESTVKQLEAALQVDQAAIDSARLNLTYSRIMAPISGRAGTSAGRCRQRRHRRRNGGYEVVITQVDRIAIVFTLPEDALRTVLPRIRAGVRLPVDAFDRAGATRLAKQRRRAHGRQ